MTQVLKIGNCTITSAEIIPLLAGYQMLPQLMQELLIDQAIASIKLTPQEKANACQQFYEKNQLTSETECRAWLAHYCMTLEQLEFLATRELKIEKFKRATWEHKLESYFLSYKSKLDKVIYSLLRTKDTEIAQELYFRIKEGEQSFAECAREYSQGPESQTGGLVGPVNLSAPHPILAQMLSVSQQGQLWSPTRLGEWLVIVRLEKLIPAQLDTSTRLALLNRLFEDWVYEQMNQMCTEGDRESFTPMHQHPKPMLHKHSITSSLNQ